MTAFHGSQSLLSQVRRAFYVIVGVMVLLLMFQLYKATKFIQHEVVREQQVAQQALHAWLVSELKQLEYTRRGLKTYKRALAYYLENGRTPAVVAALQQMHKEFELAHVVFLSEEGEAWADNGVSNLSFPHIPVLDKLPENRPRLWQLSAPYKLPFWQKVLSEPGLYGVIKIPVDYDIGDRAGTLFVFKQLLKPGESAGFFNVMLRGGQAYFFLNPPAQLPHYSALDLIHHAWRRAPLKFWQPLPAYVFQHGAAGLMVERSPQALYAMLWESLGTIVLPFFIFTVVLLVLYLALKRQIVMPLMSMAQTFIRLRKGERGMRIPGHEAASEVAYVIEQTNRMIDAQEQMTNRLESQNEQLEQIISARTEALKQANRELSQLAFTDPLTQTCNRIKFSETWKKRYSQGQHTGVGVALLNIDFFKDINETYGADVGNLVLKRAAQLLKETLGSTVETCRLGNDEFILLFPGSDHREESIQAKLEVIVERFSHQPLATIGLQMPLSVSIGWEWVPSHEICPEPELLKRLNAAMLRAKEGLSDKVQRFDPERDGAARSADFKTALRVRELVEKGEGLLLYGQPLVDAQTGETQYVEVLSRMQDVDNSPLSPGVFFPLVERLRLKVDFDRRVIERVSALLSRQKCATGGVSLNLSPETLEHPDLFEWLTPLAKLCSQYKIILEITENTLMRDLAEMRTLLKKLRKMGFKVAIDDFGSEYSSIAYLAHLNADIIKYDMSLTRAAFSNPRSRQIIFGLAEELAALGYEVVFEGVETKEMAEFFDQPFIHYLQGYYFSPPVPCAQLCDI